MSALQQSPDTSRRHVWEDVIDDEIRAISANYAERMGLRDRPALLCIDNYNAVFGESPGPLLEAMKRFPQTCGPAAWKALDPTLSLLAAARAAGIPVIHTTRDSRADASSSPMAATKRRDSGSDVNWDYSFFAPLTPAAGELVIYKSRASAFYGTPLASYLTQLGINTLIVCGNSTSGCVRASVNEAYMHGFRVGIVEECVFDRNHLSHKVNLYDMNAKYGDVMFHDEVLAYLGSLSKAQ
jgi:maleamate amidohydrolase